MRFKKYLSVAFICVLFVMLIGSVFAETIVEVKKPVQKETGFLNSVVGILKSPLVWGILLFMVLIIALGILFYYLVKKLIKYLKARSDVFFALKRERVKMAKIHRRYPSKHFFRIQKNTPIRLVKNINGKLVITNPIAYHRGDYVSHEGNVIICLNLIGKKKFFFIPETDLLVIPNRESIKINLKNQKNSQDIPVEIDNIPKAKDIVQFNENEILIFAESLSFVGDFLIPVLQSKTGEYIDLSLPVYVGLRDVVLGNFLYSQTDEFTKLAKKSMDLNPNLRYELKARDSSQSVDLSQLTGGS